MKLKREVKRVLGNRTEITADDYKQLTYATNCFQVRLSSRPVCHWRTLSTRQYEDSVL
jgi:hypothetical protein